VAVSDHNFADACILAATDGFRWESMAKFVDSKPCVRNGSYRRSENRGDSWLANVSIVMSRR
jgi:hypothetical protein